MADHNAAQLLRLSKQPQRWQSAVPIFWSALFLVVLVLDTLGMLNEHPERATGGRGVLLIGLLCGVYATHLLISWRSIYTHRPLGIWRTQAAIVAHLLTMLALSIWYAPAFGWLSIALLFQAIGGLPGRTWLLPTFGVLVVLIAGAFTVGSGTPDISTLVSGALLFVINAAIATSLRYISLQREQLGATLAQLRQAHAALAASAAQGEELAVLRERTRLARAMHDSIGHALVTMNMKLEAAQLLYARDRVRGDTELAATRDLIRATMSDLRRTLADLRAPTTAHANLPAALEQLARETQQRSGQSVECNVSSLASSLPAPAREALWFVAREALANIERHATATRIQVLLEQQSDGLRLHIADNGVGVKPADLASSAHYGVLGMRERMVELGGTLDIRPGPAGGTVVEAQMPLCLPYEQQVRR